MLCATARQCRTPADQPLQTDSLKLVPMRLLNYRGSQPILRHSLFAPVYPKATPPPAPHARWISAINLSPRSPPRHSHNALSFGSPPQNKTATSCLFPLGSLTTLSG